MCLFNSVYPVMQNYVSPNQHGFFKGIFTSTNLIFFTQHLLNTLALDYGEQVDTIYSDFWKAFDKINHAILINKLKSYGCSSKLVTLFASYLSNRKCLVTFYSFKSSFFESRPGVPRGSNLDPVLFLPFNNDLSTKLYYSNLLNSEEVKIFITLKM